MYRQAEVEPELYRIELFEVEGKPVGALAARVRKTKQRAANTFTTAIYVDPDFRRLGIGTKLLERLGTDRKKCRVGLGKQGSEEFWRTNGVTILGDKALSNWEADLTNVHYELTRKQRELKCSGISLTNPKHEKLSKTTCTDTNCFTQLLSTIKKSCTNSRSSQKESSYQSM